MRIAVIGLGAVGGALAALLDRAGHEVTAVARGETARAINQDGLRLEGERGTHLARLAVSSSPTVDAELILVAVRSYQTVRALSPHIEAIGDTPVLLLQNGLEGPATASQVLGRVSGTGIFAGLALFPATRLSRGQVRITGLGGLRIGASSPSENRQAASMAEIMNDAVPTVSTTNLRGALWAKLLVNHVNALPAITGKSVQEVCRHPLLRGVLAQALTDAVRIADASRVRFAGVGVIERAHVAEIRAGRALEVVTGRLAGAFGVVPNPASTLQSIRRGERTEIDDLDGAVVRAAAAVRMHAPIHELMVDLVHTVAGTGQFFSAVHVVECVARRQQECRRE